MQMVKKKKTYVFVTNSYNGYVGIVAAVQQFEVNLWVKDKYDTTKELTQHAENVQVKPG